MKSTISIFPKLAIAACLATTVCFATTLRASGGSNAMTLSEALEAALEQNPSVASVQALRQAADARVWEAKSGYFPQITLSAGYTRYQEPNIIIPIHEIGVFPPLDNNIYEGAASVRVPLFNGGRTGTMSRAAQASADEMRAVEDLTGIRLLESIAQVYIQSQEVHDNKALIIARLNALRQRHRELMLLLNEGRVSSADLALVVSAIESTRSDSLAIASRFYELAIRLGQLLGADEPIQPATTDPGEIEVQGFEDGLLQLDSTEATLAYAGPELRRAEAQLARAEAQYAQAASAFWPEISGFASYYLRSGGDFDPIGEWAAGISVRLPLFEGGRRLAAKDAAKSSMQAAQEQLRSTYQTQTAGLRLAFDQWQLAVSRRRHLARAVENKARSVSAHQQSYRAGRASLSELLTQETELLQLQSDERSLAYGEQLASLRYHATAGTLTTDEVKTIVRSVP